jgi:hypothetical protein
MRKAILVILLTVVSGSAAANIHTTIGANVEELEAKHL